MEENKALLETLAQLEKLNRQQARYARWQCLFSLAAALLCAGALAAVLYLMPQVNTIARQADAVLQDVQQVSSQLAQADWDALVSDLEAVSHQMAQADLGGVVEEVNSLVQTSQAGLEEALNNLNSIDFDTLNQAVEDLASVVEPLAKMFGRF